MLSKCPQCGRTIEVEPLASDIVCASCRQAAAAGEDETAWTSLARVTSLAEVGYFEDVLAREKIETRVHERDDFDAIGGLWHQTYVVQVAAADADEARRIMQDELNATANDPVDGDEGPSTFQRAVWFVLVASGLAYFGGRAVWRDDRHAAPQPPAARQHPSLWNALTESDQPWESPARNGEPARRLQYDSQRHVLTLDEDTNQDGTLDRRRVFRHGQLVLDEQR